MPKVTISKTSNLSPKDAFSKVKSLLNDDRDLKKLDPSYKCAFDDSALTGTATGKMFNASMTVKNSGASADIEIVVDLPFALGLFKGVVEKTLKKKLEESFA